MMNIHTPGSPGRCGLTESGSSEVEDIGEASF